ncbi:hypothetical protein B0H16DRAFT_1503002 [Mycena metata]|uniref:Uncharacterized protein n=1 Tax=Mycena metata TaxID=1033252 RepID=A0AAD7NWU9_9AGAR|nr:hypothetical protein B0H16DRAFT_1503002 [Mycena metata]
MSWWDYGYQIAGIADRPTPIPGTTVRTRCRTTGKPSSKTPPVLLLFGRFSELFGGGASTDSVRNQQVPRVSPTLDWVPVCPSSYLA